MAADGRVTKKREEKWQLMGVRSASWMQKESAEGERREFVGKDLLLGKGTVSVQAINKGTLWGHKEERQ